MKAEVMTAPAQGVSRTPYAIYTVIDPDDPDHARPRMIYRVTDADGAATYEIDD